MDISELRKQISEESTRLDAREICFKKLNDNPNQNLVRLELARSFYLDGLHEFAVRELVELKNYTAIASLDRLIESFGKSVSEVGLAAPVSASLSAEDDGTEDDNVVAEMDLEVDFEELLDEMEEEDSNT